MAVDLKVINTTMDEIADYRTVEGTSKSKDLSLCVHKWGFGGLSQEKKTSASKAIRA